MTEPYNLAPLNSRKDSTGIAGEYYNNDDKTIDWQYEMDRRRYDISHLARL